MAYKFKTLQNIHDMIDRLEGFTENQTTLIKSISSQSFETGIQWHPDNTRQKREIKKLKDAAFKSDIKINDLEKIIATLTKAETEEA